MQIWESATEDSYFEYGLAVRELRTGRHSKEGTSLAVSSWAGSPFTHGSRLRLEYPPATRHWSEAWVWTQKALLWIHGWSVSLVAPLRVLQRVSLSGSMWPCSNQMSTTRLQTPYNTIGITRRCRRSLRWFQLRPTTERLRATLTAGRSDPFNGGRHEADKAHATWVPQSINEPFSESWRANATSGKSEWESTCSLTVVVCGTVKSVCCRRSRHAVRVALAGEGGCRRPCGARRIE